MKKLLMRIPAFVYFFYWANLLFSGSALARPYVDPATTSYIIQIVAGVFIACGAFVGIFWKKIRLYFRDKKLKMLEKQLTKKR
jgi:hypothetical protein